MYIYIYIYTCMHMYKHTSLSLSTYIYIYICRGAPTLAAARCALREAQQPMHPALKQTYITNNSINAKYKITKYQW